MAMNSNFLPHFGFPAAMESRAASSSWSMEVPHDSE
jgi:hypothetical protein